MSKKLYALFLHLDAAYFEGVYDSQDKCKAALAEVEKQLASDGEKIELTEDMYDIVETEINDSINFVVAEYDDVEDEEYED
jgi:hypothetical protein